jgi:ketosteroid isomerase-like protein
MTMPKKIKPRRAAKRSNPTDSPLLYPPVSIVREFYTHFAKRDLDRAFALLSPRIELSQVADLPWAGRFKGLNGVRKFFSAMSEHVYATPEPLTFLPAGDEVAVVARLRGTARATGKAVDQTVVHLWTVYTGKIIRAAAYVDAPAIKEALIVH